MTSRITNIGNVFKSLDICGKLELVFFNKETKYACAVMLCSVLIALFSGCKDREFSPLQPRPLFKPKDVLGSRRIIKHWGHVGEE